MPQKRQQEDANASHPRSQVSGNSSDDKRRKVPSFKNVVSDVMRLLKVQRFLEPVLEPLIRRVVKEEVESALRKYMTSVKWNWEEEMHPSESRTLQLQFLNTVSLPVFTGTRIEGENCTSIKVALVDALTGQVVSNGPESSAKVEIIVLEGDFDGDEADNWTLEEFKYNIVREREGKKPLLTGDAFLSLKEGIGLVGDISFTDNSSWTRSRKFRLGARVLDNYDGIRVREAKTESFIVRDHRGELYKKHHPPSLVDEVWRLEKIGKDGAFHKRLSKEKVNSVKDFLTLFFIDPTRLRNILGMGMSAKMWEVMVDHARTCVLDKRLYLYYPPGSQQKTGVVFNVVGQVMGLSSDCQYLTIDKMSETEKADAHNSVISAFGHWEEAVPFDDETFLMDSTSHLSNVLYPSNSSRTESSDGSKILTSQKVGKSNYPQLISSSPNIMPSIYSMGGMSSLGDFDLHIIDPMDVTFNQPSSFSGQIANFFISDTDSTTQVLCEDEHLQYFKTDLESPADLNSAVSSVLVGHSAAVVGKAQRRWTIVFSIFRWFSIRRIVASRSHERQLQR